MKNSIKHKIQWIVLFICLIGFLVLVENIFNKEIIKGDIIGYNIISNLLISSTVTPVARGITFLGGTIFIISSAVLLFIIIKNKKIGFLILANLAIVATLNQLLKHILKRPPPTGYRFLIYLIYKYVKNKYIKWISICILSIFICLIGISRIYLGVHYTSDVLAGFLISITYLIMYIEIVNKFVLEKGE